MSDALYLYGFVGAAALPPPSTLRGVAGRSVELIELGKLRAAFSSVPADEFAPERVEERVHDLDWVGEQGALHERVVTWFVDHGGILPVRLLTLYSGAEALRRSVAGEEGALTRQLERLRDLREWDLKVSYDAETLQGHLGEVSEEVAGLDREIQQATPGKRYLLERKRGQLVSQETSRVALQLAAELHDRLRELSSDARRLALPRDRADLPVVLNAAYLVPTGREQEVRSAAATQADRLGAIGVEVRLTGPWAPYRFLNEESAEDEGGDSAGA